MIDIRQALASASGEAPPGIPDERVEAEYRKLMALQRDMKDFLGAINLVYQDPSMHGVVPPTGAKGEPFDFFSIGINAPRGQEVDALVTRTGILFFSDGRVGSLPDPLPKGEEPPSVESMVAEDWHHRIRAYLEAYPEGTAPIVKAVQDYQAAFYDNVAAKVGQ